jgi:hypothetical protein
MTKITTLKLNGYDINTCYLIRGNDNDNRGNKTKVFVYIHTQTYPQQIEEKYS